MHGFVDTLEAGAAIGWAETIGGGAVEVALIVDGAAVAAVPADLPRPDIGRPCGFRIALPPPVGAAELLSGHAWIEARGTDGAALRLTLSDPAALVEAMVGPHLRTMPGVALRELFRRVVLDRVWTDRSPPLFDPRVEPGAVSRFAMPVGLLAPDGEVIVGHDDHLFLVTGSNGLIGQYLPAPGVEAQADGWAALFGRRAAALAARGVDYLQLVIPEKASVLAEQVPFALDPPTPLYAALAARLAETGIACPDLFAAMRAAPDRDALFLRLDSHVSARGAAFLFARMLDALALPPLPPIAFTTRERCPIADLAHHFPWQSFVEDDLVPAGLPVTDDAVELVFEHRPPRHHGTRLVFRNPRAPIPRRVVAFANSFFLGGKHPQMLSWWMKHWFAEYHFVWQSEVDLAYVDAVRPDLVVAQTVERFLPILPDS